MFGKSLKTEMKSEPTQKLGSLLVGYWLKLLSVLMVILSNGDKYWIYSSYNNKNLYFIKH